MKSLSFIICCVFGVVVSFFTCVALVQVSTNCETACHPDPVQECYKDRAICVSKDGLTVKLKKEY